MVDDGSTDDVAAIARRFAGRDHRFRLVTQPHGGLARARNTGADQARGEFLCFVDSDDKLAPDFCELLLAALDQTGSDFATGNVCASTARARARRRSSRARSARRGWPPTSPGSAACSSTDRPQQDVAPVVLGRARFRFPEGRRARGRPGRRARPVPGPLGRRHRRPRLPVSRARGRRPLDHAAAQRAADAARSARRRRVRDRVPGPGVGAEARRWYQESAVAEDLRYHLNVLGDADDAYRADVPGPRQRLPRPGSGRRREGPSGDRPPQVPPRPPASASRAARGPALPPGGARARRADPRTRRLGRRLPLPGRPPPGRSRACVPPRGRAAGVGHGRVPEMGRRRPRHPGDGVADRGRRTRARCAPRAPHRRAPGTARATAPPRPPHAPDDRDDPDGRRLRVRGLPGPAARCAGCAAAGAGTGGRSTCSSWSATAASPGASRSSAPIPASPRTRRRERSTARRPRGRSGSRAATSGSRCAAGGRRRGRTGPRATRCASRACWASPATAR